MQRTSQHPVDEVTYQTVGARLGVKGLDLREPSEPDSLVELLNARFVDDRTIRPRDGHLGVLVQDGSSFAPLGSGYAVRDGWVYGHGKQVADTNALSWENAHHPIAGRGHTTFRYRDADLVHTGDRLLAIQSDRPAIGSSDYWSRGGGSLARGIPAFLPVQEDHTPPATVGAEYVETCLTTKYRAFVDSHSGVNVWLLDRSTQAIVDVSEISGASNDSIEPVVINSGDYVVVLWRDFTDRHLYMNWWTGSSWHGAATIANNVGAFDVAEVPGGIHVLWRDEAAANLKIGRFAGITAQSSPYAFGAAVNISAAAGTAVGVVALAVSPSGDIGIAFMADTQLQGLSFSPSLTPRDITWATLGATPDGTNGCTLISRGLKAANGLHQYVCYFGGTTGGLYTQAVAFTLGSVDQVGTKRWNSTLASSGFRVGDEVFCWMRTTNAQTHYLVSGCGPQTVCGFSDREEALSCTSHDGNYGVPRVHADPLGDGTQLTWVRRFNTGQSFGHPGNTRYGDISFLPPVNAVQFGRSVYLSGSAVRNWDGITLGDAGFQDYPVVTGTAQATGGTLTLLGPYRFRVYAVRYNARGERFESAALSTAEIDLTGSNNKITLTIATLPDTNHSDITFEVYRTQALGTTYYLDGTVANSLAAPSVSFATVHDDATLLTQFGDAHAAGVGQLSTLQSWGPLGCSMLAVSGDRLWGAGGQVTPGFVQFSKLHEDGSGAGFDDLAGFQEVNTEGDAITSVVSQNDATVIFQVDKLYVIAGTGPDNYGRGAFDIPNIVLADGAITHFGTAPTQVGTVFWGQEGPRLLTLQYQVLNISSPVRPYTETLSPSGVIVSLPRAEVVWYTSSGDAVLWNYLDGATRWARWSGLYVAGCSATSLVTTTGVLLTESEDAIGDNGRGFPFTFRISNLRAEDLLQGHTLIRSVGVLGLYKGPHKLRLRVYFNGSPAFSDEWTWQPDASTWLAPGTDFASLTPAQIDALPTLDKSGAYMTHKRVSRANCHHLSVEVSNIYADAPTLIPFELSFELGATGGPGRVPVNTFTNSTSK